MNEVKAFLLDGVTVELTIEGVEDTLNYLYLDWLKMGSPCTLALPTVQAGQFRGYVNENGAPIGQFKTDDGAIYQIYEDSAEMIA